MTRRLRAVIADDEPLARARLRRLLGREPDVEVIAECATGLETATTLARVHPDVVFLDIHMPDGDGFATLQAVPNHERPRVVFVTAYSEHAVRAFDTQALDYLVKPLSEERLREAVARVRRSVADARSQQLDSALGTRPERRPAPDYPVRLGVPIGSRVRLIATSQIDYVTAQANYVELHCGTRAFLLRETLASLERRLDPTVFLRVHRSRLVKLASIDDIEPLASGQYVIRLTGGVRLTSGRSYRHALREALGLRDGT